MNKSKVTVPKIKKMKEEREKIVMLTAYDFPFSKLLDEAGIDIILVGDSLGNVILGYENTLPVTMEEMLHHTKAVARGRNNALLIADMPFMSYQLGPDQALLNASRFIKEAGAEGVKLEGGVAHKETIEKLVQCNIPVMGHIGLMPQSIHKIGGYKVQGKTKKEADAILKDARVVEKAGAFSIVLDGIPIPLAKKISSEVKIPTIGIGSGPYCDGQVLVIHDILGFDDQFHPKFVKKYANIKKTIIDAVTEFKEEVKKGKFPTENHGFK
ncbi:MAG: 3-methyl-2-oxobutanoate hydroxymethyltransferase [Candidatus Schekmanbacteria bacterium RIFCSPHIGHO2_02_FULL_38_11]|uniref:3-methyl-2-oxobutanoate hydroxymethyltransferase n=1 Tax=Candidatus Schekmanbacteria bacterium RIFCSPLOWO2_12_FULL_38_15 TaxID=1817883 RepID=A0A1F7SMN1_9BACT|nr:MAG: 3-methyl-2-oxobutanoate hydroxymethyltransferase [Candidatus Schekmanbacteria bacterium GWA2_38_9]OGL48048.1 MAG: 3-methyl-2-oxobutanoate hydroxymethyltransferase [Candidatus Schekmanbacteria bacterium RIFCSPLOWO2_02_FULL_38_14]OGL50712.1 MAG: 3-methyl-2-oxobutanoate hydroxymethyltransferase [Candidatus Schekmanbacteria bacterium RIFCSPHIGHO2_02_FULL_38_11]OGL54467.1 MAG: 3-methyl-2-oxobutanoate hydroxymethyltransferase [Candidatus Schekmanbacteria bacterium RIFCSPLOWO2_12_FULL_38_15]